MDDRLLIDLQKLKVFKWCHLWTEWIFPLNSVVGQEYETDVNKEYVIRGNSAVLKCQWPSFMADYLSIDSWMVDTTLISPSDHNGIYGHSSSRREEVGRRSLCK